jgi:4-hydroxy-2-oxoheptanedioate aldolase
MQHGLIDYPNAVSMLQAISTTETTPMARVNWNEPGQIMKNFRCWLLWSYLSNGEQ